MPDVVSIGYVPCVKVRLAALSTGINHSLLSI
jgi:hypothetical protein